MLFSPSGVSLDGWKAELTSKGLPRDLSEFGKQIARGTESDCQILVVSRSHTHTHTLSLLFHTSHSLARAPIRTLSLP